MGIESVFAVGLAFVLMVALTLVYFARSPGIHVQVQSTRMTGDFTGKYLWADLRNMGSETLVLKAARVTQRGAEVGTLHLPGTTLFPHQLITVGPVRIYPLVPSGDLGLVLVDHHGNSSTLDLRGSSTK